MTIDTARTATSSAPDWKPIVELDQAWQEWPRGDRLEALRAAAPVFKARFIGRPRVHAIGSFDIAAAPYLVRYGFNGEARAVGPYISIVNRMLVIQFDDFRGVRRTLVWEPTVPAGSELAPFYAQLVEGARTSTLRAIGRRLVNRTYNTLESALARAGISADEVDFVSFDHLHVQDLRMIMPAFPNAQLIVQDAELATLESLHPMQWAWYVDGGADQLDDARVLRCSGSIELGNGVAIVATPGHTDGNHSLVVNTPTGVWVSSENGISADNWQPDRSRIPGVAKHARFYGREVCPNANTLENAVSQYDSMVLEKLLADPAGDSGWLQILPSSELAPWRRQWPVVPTHWHGPLNFGVLKKSGHSS